MVRAFAFGVPSYLVLGFCLLITGISAYFSREMVQAEERVRFERIAQSVEDAVKARIQIYENVLLATRNLFNSHHSVTREEFRDFVAGFMLQDKYPGIQGIGFTIRISPEDLERHIEQSRAKGLPHYRVWPDYKRDEYFSIYYLEPSDWRNQRAIGYDMYSEPVRRKAMATARDTGEPRASGKVTLVQETETDVQPGFLIYVPLYEPGMPIETVEQRREALRGFIYSPFRARDLFLQISNEVQHQQPRARIQIYDGVSPISENIIFSSSAPVEAGAFGEDARFRKESRIQIAGQQWTILLASTPTFELRPSRALPWYVLGLGAVISFLIFFILRISGRMMEKLREQLAFKENSEREVSKAMEMAEEANRAKTRFLANMSHEIRTPLGVIIGFADLAIDATDQEQDVHRYLHVIKRNGQQLANLIGEVLDLSKIEADKLEIDIERASLPSILDEIVSSLDIRAREKGVVLSWNRESEIPETIRTDVIKFKQILINLIGNAIKFTNKGEVRVVPQLLSKPEVGQPMDLEILIEDTGIGIACEHRKNLFEPFTQADPSMTRRYGGTGLGLMLSRQLSRALGGDVRLVSSEVGKGSVFSLRLPCGPFERAWRSDLAGVEAMDLKEPSRVNDRPLKNVRLLLVEDSKDNQVLVSRYLKAAGATVEIADNGAEGVEKAAGDGFDLVLMDIQMPFLDGHQATEMLRSKGYRKPIIALTAHAFKEERDRAIRGGFNGYLTKPLSRSVLIQEIKSSLQGGQSN